MSPRIASHAHIYESMGLLPYSEIVASSAKFTRLRDQTPWSIMMANTACFRLLSSSTSLFQVKVLYVINLLFIVLSTVFHVSSPQSVSTTIIEQQKYCNYFWNPMEHVVFLVVYA